MRERFLFSTLLVAMLGCVPALPAHAQKDGDAVPAAAEAVREVLLDQAARARADALWGRPFMAPVALHDPVSGRSWRWSGDAGARFEPLRLPEGLPPANTCIELEGRPTALMVLPLPEGRDELAVLAWHELCIACSACSAFRRAVRAGPRTSTASRAGPGCGWN